MTEPFLLAMPGEPEDGIWRQPAPMEFRNPLSSVCLVIMTSRIIAGDRGMYTEAEIKADPQIVKSAADNTASNKLRMNTDNDFISIRSNKTRQPCAAAFLLPGRRRLFSNLRLDPSQYYFVFITQDEVLMAQKDKFKPSAIRKVTASMANKIRSLHPEGCPIVATEVFSYDPESDSYQEA